MNLRSAIELFFGGEGSGCNPAAAEANGTACGPPVTKQFDYKNLKQQALAIKSLSTEFTRAVGTQYVYRGIKGSIANKVQAAIDSGKAVEVPLNSLSSWSLSPTTAQGFGNTVLRMKINPEDVWVNSRALLHMFGGMAGEQELIVGSKTPTVTFTPDDVKTYGHKPSWWKGSKYD